MLPLKSEEGTIYEKLIQAKRSKMLDIGMDSDF
jgi:hypothetical protein